MTTYYHGGVPGLKVGEYILPRAETKNAAALGAVADRHNVPGREVIRPDRVYLGTHIDVGRLYAGVYPGGGWVYRVDPELPLEPDPDCSEPGLSWACPRARILEAVPLSKADVREIVRAFMAGRR